MYRPHTNPLRRQSGLTLVELLVAITLTILIVMAAVATINVSRKGFSTVDASGQLDDNARFATDILQKIMSQAGYRDVPFAAAAGGPQFNMAGANEPALFIEGFNNAVVKPSLDPIAVNGNRPASCAASAGTACNNGSDVLVIRAQAAMKFAGAELGSKSDEAIINCRGSAEEVSAMKADDLVTSIFFVAIDSASKEPALKCMAPNGGNTQAIPLVQGVESMQILYGVDNVTAGTASQSASDPLHAPRTPTNYLRAEQLTVAGNAAATQNNWRRVKSVRIGLLLRGSVGSAFDAGTATQYPLGRQLGSTADVGTALVPAADRRLRRTVTFTVHLHNQQQI